MSSTIQTIESARPPDVLNAIKRRPVGRSAWKMTIAELMESERTGIQLLRSIGNKHPNDAETQRLVSNAALEAADRLIKLNELLYYKEGTHENGVE